MIIEKEVLIPDWKINFPGLICGFSLPVLGNQALTRKSISTKQSTKQNRINLANHLKINSRYIFYPHQIHSDIIITVTEKNRGMGAYSINNAIKGDACITNKENILLMITWADCIPVLLYDPYSKWMGAIHTGWKGTLINLADKTINALKVNTVNIKNIYAAIGPGIRDCCYKVGDEFKMYFKDTGLSSFLIEKENDLYFDLAGSVHKQLIEAGIEKRKIDFYGKCNSCSEDPYFFSCRKDGKNFEGQAAFIGLF